MSLESELHEDMLALYRRSGEELGYWGNRYLQAVRRKGGLATAKAMLRPGTTAQRAGLDKLLEAGRPDLALEHLILRPKYKSLFTAQELAEARKRLAAYKRLIKNKTSERLYPDELKLGIKYPEGARKQVRVNAYERSARARQQCLKHHGTNCAVCDMSFKERYGQIGDGFIHVHHLVPIASVGNDYRVDPLTELAPVCPNCHAMLHRPDSPLTIEQLRAIVHQQAS